MKSLVWAYKNMFNEPRLSYGIARVGDFRFDLALEFAKEHVANQVPDGRMLYVMQLPHQITLVALGEAWHVEPIAKGPWPEIWDTFVAHVQMWME